jgi:hypothetical protein
LLRQATIVAIVIKAYALAAIRDCHDKLLLMDPHCHAAFQPRYKLLSHEGLANAESADLRFADLLVSSPQAKHSFDDEATSIFSCSGPRSRYGE